MGGWREDWREANRANWDERVPIHVSGEFYDLASFKGGQERLQPFEIDDVVYTGRGAIIWLPDIGRWAEVVADLLEPGGFLYLTEFHPLTDIFGDEDLSVEHDYFQDENPRVWDEPGTYADFDAETHNNVTYEWNHTLGDVVSAVSAAGLSIELLHEYDYTVFPRWPILEKS